MPTSPLGEQVERDHDSSASQFQLLLPLAVLITLIQSLALRGLSLSKIKRVEMSKIAYSYLLHDLWSAHMVSSKALYS